MLAKLWQLECAQGFVHLMYNLLEMLGKFMDFMLPSGSVVARSSQRLLPVRTPNHLMRMRMVRRSVTPWSLSGTGRTRHFSPARRSSSWSPFSE